MECEEGYFHASNFSDIVRETINSKPIINKRGMLQLISPLAFDFPT